jgi:hypothetical protein
MMTLVETPVNRVKVSRAEALLSEMLAESLRRGFHGTAVLEVSIQDGTIQHIRRRLERIEK